MLAEQTIKDGGVVFGACWDKEWNIFFIVGCMAAIVAGEIVRLFRLPKDIRAHLADTGRRKR